MTEHHPDDDAGFAAVFRRAYSRTASTDGGARARLDDALRAAPRIRHGVLTLRPAAAMAAAAALVVTGGVIGALLTRGIASRNDRIARGTETGAVVNAAATPMHAIRFVIVTPANHVSVVGDFNGWDAEATPMVRGEAGTWTTTVRMPVGWHAYAFVVDGEWQADPTAPLAPSDDYGTRRSVVVVGGT